jgi:hypothetical protein
MQGLKGHKRKFSSLRGWITIYFKGTPKNSWDPVGWKPWSMSIYRNNGAVYATVYSKTKKELFGLMRIEIRQKKDPKFAALHKKMGGAQGSLYGDIYPMLATSYDINDKLQVSLNGKQQEHVIVGKSVFLTVPAGMGKRKK